jgi:hypothetical protein
VSYKPFAVSDNIKLDYFKRWFQKKRDGECIKLLGESVDEGALKVALKNKRIPEDEILKIAAPTVFGKGNKTVFDTNVRKAWDKSLLIDDVMVVTTSFLLIHVWINQYAVKSMTL